MSTNHITRKDAEQEEPDTVAVLSERSPIRLGLILGMFSVAVATIGAAWYLASSLTKIETKLDAISTQMTVASTAVTSMERRQAEHEREDNNNWRAMDTRVSIIERIGSPQLMQFEKRLNDIENSIQVHILRTQNGNGAAKPNP